MTCANNFFITLYMWVRVCIVFFYFGFVCSEMIKGWAVLFRFFNSFFIYYCDCAFLHKNMYTRTVGYRIKVSLVCTIFFVFVLLFTDSINYGSIFPINYLTVLKLLIISFTSTTKYRDII